MPTPLADPVRLRGDLCQSHLTPDRRAALKVSVPAAAAIATEGLSRLAQGLLGKKTANKDPRTAALGMNTVDTALAKADQTE